MTDRHMTRAATAKALSNQRENDNVNDISESPVFQATETPAGSWFQMDTASPPPEGADLDSGDMQCTDLDTHSTGIYHILHAHRGHHLLCLDIGILDFYHHLGSPLPTHHLGCPLPTHHLGNSLPTL